MELQCNGGEIEEDVSQLSQWVLQGRPPSESHQTQVGLDGTVTVVRKESSGDQAIA